MIRCRRVGADQFHGTWHPGRVPRQERHLRNLDVHDNWQVDILAKGNTNTNGNGISDYVENMLIEDSRAMTTSARRSTGRSSTKPTAPAAARPTGRSSRKRRGMRPIGWHRHRLRRPHADRHLGQVWGQRIAGASLATTGGSKTNYIDPENIATAAQIAYDGEDIVVYNSATGQWSKYRRGRARPTHQRFDRHVQRR